MSETPPNSGEWLGEATRIGVREAGEDADNPLLEIHGEEGMAAAEMTEEMSNALSHAAAELNLAMEDD